METNPYSPPKAALADYRPAGLKRRRVITMIVFSMVTFGSYYPIWFLRRRAALNRLDSPRKLRLWPFVIIMAWFVAQFILGIATGIAASITGGPATPRQVFGEGTDLLLNLLQLAVAILLVVQSFFTKDILEDHLAGPGDQVPNPLLVDSVKLSGVMTFFFQIFYLQYVINRYLAGSKWS